MSEHRKAIAVHGAANFSIALGLSGLGQACLVRLNVRPFSRLLKSCAFGASSTELVDMKLRSSATMPPCGWLQSSSPASTSSSDLLVRITVGLIRWAVEAIFGRYAEPVPVIVSIPLGATRRP